MSLWICAKGSSCLVVGSALIVIRSDHAGVVVLIRLQIIEGKCAGHTRFLHALLFFVPSSEPVVIAIANVHRPLLSLRKQSGSFWGQRCG